MNDSIEGIEPYKYVPQVEDVRRQAALIGSFIVATTPFMPNQFTDFAAELKLRITDDEHDMGRIPPPVRDSPKNPDDRILCFNMPTFDGLLDESSYFEISPGEIAELYSGTGLAARMLEDQIDHDDREKVELVVSRLDDKERLAQAIFQAEVFNIDERLELLDVFDDINADDIIRINVLRFGFGIMAQANLMDQGYVDEILDPANNISARAAKVFSDGIRATFKARAMHTRLLSALGRDENFIKQHNADLFSHFQLAACLPMDKDEIKYVLEACWGVS